MLQTIIYFLDQVPTSIPLDSLSKYIHLSFAGSQGAEAPLSRHWDERQGIPFDKLPAGTSLTYLWCMCVR